MLRRRDRRQRGRPDSSMLEVVRWQTGAGVEELELSEGVPIGDEVTNAIVSRGELL